MGDKERLDWLTRSDSKSIHRRRHKSGTERARGSDSGAESAPETVRRMKCKWLVQGDMCSDPNRPPQCDYRDQVECPGFKEAE